VSKINLGLRQQLIFIRCDLKTKKMKRFSELPQKSPIRRYAILGTGALGGFYGARLQRAGLDVHFLLHNDYDVVCKSGLVVESKQGDFTLPHVKAYQDVRNMPPCDVVIVSLKTTHNHFLAEFGH
jgi:hypothetical protein